MSLECDLFDACAADTNNFLSLIRLVSDYMRIISTIKAIFSRSQIL